MTDRIIPFEVDKFYKIIPLKELRRTPGVCFDYLPNKDMPKISSIDRVIHTGGAISPGPVGNIERPWYMHPYQADNLMVLYGKRFVDIYAVEHKKLMSFEITANSIIYENEVIFDGPAILVWPCNVFHRIRSCPVEGSASVNLATHYDGFNIKDNFNIYDLNPETGEYKVIREGHLDQPK